MSLITREGLLVAIALSILPFLILGVLLKILPPWPDNETPSIEALPTP
jgi:hypothetical protein